MVCLANPRVSHPHHPFLHLNWSFTGSRWVIGWKFSIWCGGHIYFQTQHERVQSSILNVINKEAWNLLSIFLVAVIALPGLLEKLYNSWMHVTHTDGEVPQAVWQNLPGVHFSNFCLLNHHFIWVWHFYLRSSATLLLTWQIKTWLSHHPVTTFSAFKIFYYPQYASLRLTLNYKMEVYLNLFGGTCFSPVV